MASRLLLMVVYNSLILTRYSQISSQAVQVPQQHSDYYEHHDRCPQAQAYQYHPPRSSPPISPGPHNSRKLPPPNMPDRYQGSYDAVVSHAPNYGDIRSSPTTYPTVYISHPSQMSYSYPSVSGPRHHSSHLPTVRHSQQMSYSTAERGLPTQVEAQGPYARESITNIKLTKESAPVMANEKPTINEMRNAAQLTVLNDSYTHTSLSSTGEHAKLVRSVYTPVRVTVILIPLIGFRTNSSQFQVLKALASFLH
jgi:homeobox protein YOX1/YHP1